jgi:hypothetical protein
MLRIRAGVNGVCFLIMKPSRWVGAGCAPVLVGLAFASADCSGSSHTQPAVDASDAGDATPPADVRTHVDASKRIDASYAGEGGGDSGQSGLVCADPTGATLMGTLSTSQLGGRCDDSIGGAPVGKPCKSGADCKPACCACPGDAGRFTTVSVGYCKKGACATAEDSCCTFALQERLSGGGAVCP